MLAKRLPLVACSLSIITATIVTQPARSFADTLFMDDFDDGVIDPRYTPIGSATLTEFDGQMRVATISPEDGIRIDLSDFPSVACHVIDFSLDSSTAGDAFLWKWIVRDDENNVFPILELELSGSTPQGRQLGLSTTKKDKDGNVVTVAEKSIVYVNEDKYRVKWDRKTVNGVEYVQLEIINRSTGEYFLIFPWQDPPPTQTVGFEMTTSFDTITFDFIGLESEHVPIIPTLPEWGLIAMAVLVLTAGTVVFGRRRRAAA